LKSWVPKKIYLDIKKHLLGRYQVLLQNFHEEKHYSEMQINKESNKKQCRQPNIDVSNIKPSFNDKAITQ